eukprot:GFKZ01001464.1.p1 GENE.GFKZ01001464.1~~GFKZ01001464.1.p1  ORF type:complete len:160 (-),score=0.99 GFKZ01001464.1:37-516(-)
MQSSCSPTDQACRYVFVSPHLDIQALGPSGRERPLHFVPIQHFFPYPNTKVPPVPLEKADRRKTLDPEHTRSRCLGLPYPHPYWEPRFRSHPLHLGSFGIALPETIKLLKKIILRITVRYHTICATIRALVMEKMRRRTAGKGDAEKKDKEEAMRHRRF